MRDRLEETEYEEQVNEGKEDKLEQEEIKDNGEKERASVIDDAYDFSKYEQIEKADEATDVEDRKKLEEKEVYDFESYEQTYELNEHQENEEINEEETEAYNFESYEQDLKDEQSIESNDNSLENEQSEKVDKEMVTDSPDDGLEAGDSANGQVEVSEDAKSEEATIGGNVQEDNSEKLESNLEEPDENSEEEQLERDGHEEGSGKVLESDVEQQSDNTKGNLKGSQLEDNAESLESILEQPSEKPEEKQLEGEGLEEGSEKVLKSDVEQQSDNTQENLEGSQSEDNSEVLESNVEQTNEDHKEENLEGATLEEGTEKASESEVEQQSDNTLENVEGILLEDNAEELESNIEQTNENLKEESLEGVTLEEGSEKVPESGVEQQSDNSLENVEGNLPEDNSEALESNVEETNEVLKEVSLEGATLEEGSEKAPESGVEQQSENTLENVEDNLPEDYSEALESNVEETNEVLKEESLEGATLEEGSEKAPESGVEQQSENTQENIDGSLPEDNSEALDSSPKQTNEELKEEKLEGGTQEEGSEKAPESEVELQSANAQENKKGNLPEEIAESLDSNPEQAKETREAEKLEGVGLEEGSEKVAESDVEQQSADAQESVEGNHPEESKDSLDSNHDQKKENPEEELIERGGQENPEKTLDSNVEQQSKNGTDNLESNIPEENSGKAPEIGSEQYRTPELENLESDLPNDKVYSQIESSEENKKKETEEKDDTIWNIVHDKLQWWETESEGKGIVEILKNSWIKQVEMAKEGPEAWLNYNKEELKKDISNIYVDGKRIAGILIEKNDTFKDIKEVFEERQKQRVENGEGQTLKEMIHNGLKGQIEAARRGPKDWWEYNKESFSTEARNLFEDSKKLASRFIDRQDMLSDIREVLKERHEQRVENGEGGSLKEMLGNGIKAQLEAAKEGSIDWLKYNKESFSEEARNLFEDSKKLASRYIDRHDMLGDIRELLKDRHEQRIENGEGSSLKDMFRNGIKSQLEAAKEGPTGWLKYNKESFTEETRNLFEDGKKLASQFIDHHDMLSDIREVLKERHEQRIESGEGGSLKDMFRNGIKAQLEATKGGPIGWLKYNKESFSEETRNLYEDGKKLTNRYLERHETLSNIRDVLLERHEKRIENGEGTKISEMFQNGLKAQLEAAKQGPKAWWEYNKESFSTEARNLFKDFKDFVEKQKDNGEKPEDIEIPVDNKDNQHFIFDTPLNGRVEDLDNINEIEDAAIEDLEQWALANKITDMVDYTGLDPKVAQEWNKGIAENIEMFPELRDRIKFIGSAQARNNTIRTELEQMYLESYKQSNPTFLEEDLMPYVISDVDALMDRLPIRENTIAQSLSAPSGIISEFNGITINEKYGCDHVYFTHIKEKDVASKHKPVGCDNIKSTVDHEMGHQIDALLSLSTDTDIIDLYRQTLNTGDGKNQLSGYGMTKVAEFIAEAWSEYKNNPEPRPVSIKVAEIIERRYEAWKKKRK
ncbi:hypothetical protein [Bacillus sp. PS06]|uniref:hypothetical protein n=1 Tax=Bacillus sp. PS06 TaxID=2764176 RepID=UPI00177ABF6E|nr:hypothetical protein [Bacillus sp. PS06]MBD8070709.1 hypothetical protein [Bacillus sp. PS06]